MSNTNLISRLSRFKDFLEEKYSLEKISSSNKSFIEKGMKKDDFDLEDNKESLNSIAKQLNLTFEELKLQYLHYYYTEELTCTFTSHLFKPMLDRFDHMNSEKIKKRLEEIEKCVQKSSNYVDPDFKPLINLFEDHPEDSEVINEVLMKICDA